LLADSPDTALHLCSQSSRIRFTIKEIKDLKKQSKMSWLLQERHFSVKFKVGFSVSFPNCHDKHINQRDKTLPNSHSSVSDKTEHAFSSLDISLWKCLEKCKKKLIYILQNLS